MSAGPNDLCQLSDALGWLGLLTDDSNGTVQTIVTAMSTSIQNYLGYNIAVSTYNDVYNGIGSQRLILRNRPVVSVTTLNLVVGFAGLLNIPPRVVGGNIAGSAGFSNDDKAIYLDDPYRFERGYQNIQVTYQAGYATVPADLKLAAMMWMQGAFLSSASGGGIAANVSEAKAGDHSLKFSFTISELKTGSVLIPPSVLSLIGPYRRVTPV